MTYTWERIREPRPDASGGGPTPFDGAVYLWGTQERIFSGPWASLKTVPDLSKGPVFWMPLPKKGAPGWLSPEDTLDVMLGTRPYPLNQRLLIRLKHTKNGKWLEARYSPEKDTWDWTGNGPQKSKAEQPTIAAGFLIDDIPKIRPEDLIIGPTEPLWA